MPNEAWGSVEAGAIPGRVLSSLGTGVKQGLEPLGLPALVASQLGGELTSSQPVPFPQSIFFLSLQFVSPQAQDKSLPSLCLLGGEGRGAGQGRDRGGEATAGKPFAPK